MVILQTSKNQSTGSFTKSRHIIEIKMERQRQLSSYAVAMKELQNIQEKSFASKMRKNGWSVEIQNKDWFEKKTIKHGIIEYKVYFCYEFDPKRDAETLKIEWETVLSNLVNVVQEMKPKNPKQPCWEIGLVDGETINKDEIQSQRAGRPVQYAICTMPNNWDDYFKHLYNREIQIDRIKKSIQAGIASGFKNRFHAVLVGKPACGKSDILESVVKALNHDSEPGEECARHFEGTSTSMVGAIKQIDEWDVLPRFLIIEEIEKCVEDHLRWLLGLMDQRAEVRRNVNRYNIQKETRCIVYATVNDYLKFRDLLSGALASRFTNHIMTPDLDIDIIRKILMREVAKVQGNPKWVEPVLKWAQVQKIFDPRMLIADMLCGADEWLIQSKDAPMPLYADKLLQTSVQPYIDELIKEKGK